MLGFRALQAVMDLRAAAGRQPQASLGRIADWIAPADREAAGSDSALPRVLVRQGCRLTAEDRALLDVLMIAASQPDTDRGAFVLATATLLADRLQGGFGGDDLGSYWDSFVPNYALLDPQDRAAILQGFLTGNRLGRVRMTSPAPEEDRLSLPARAVRPPLLELARWGMAQLEPAVAAGIEPAAAPLVTLQLTALAEGRRTDPLTGDSPAFPPLLALAGAPETPAGLAATALLLAEAVATGDAEGWFAVSLWTDRIQDWLALPPAEGRAILAGLRYLYEADPLWTPLPDRQAQPRVGAQMALLPVLDETFGPENPGARVG